jgi:hypothetical protein
MCRARKEMHEDLEAQKGTRRLWRDQPCSNTSSRGQCRLTPGCLPWSPGIHSWGPRTPSTASKQ